MKAKPTILSPTLLRAAASALEHLGAQCRIVHMGGCALFFCAMPDGADFTLLADSAGQIRLRRLISLLPEGRERIRLGCEAADYPGTAASVEISAGGEVSLRMEQTVSPDDPALEARVSRLIGTFAGWIRAGEMLPH